MIQAEHGLGLDVQREQIEAWAEAGGHTVTAWFADEGISGDKDELDRPGLARALKTVEDGGVEGLVVYRLDRLARRLFRQEIVVHKMKTLGRSFWSVQEPDVDSDDPTRVLIRQILGAFAEYERAVITMRLQGGRKAKSARGGFAGYGSPAFGWRSVDKELTADGSEQATVARILELDSAGATLRSIVDTLEVEGRPAKRGGRWHPKTVARVIGRARPEDSIELPIAA